jgi:hypothetical protein
MAVISSGGQRADAGSPPQDRAKSDSEPNAPAAFRLVRLRLRPTKLVAHIHGFRAQEGQKLWRCDALWGPSGRRRSRACTSPRAGRFGQVKRAPRFTSPEGRGRPREARRVRGSRALNSPSVPQRR